MARYNCFTQGEYFNLLKRDAKEAIKSLDKENQKEVLSVIDEIAFHALNMGASARALERMAQAHGISVEDGASLREYMKYEAEEKQKYNTYKYEVEEK